MRFELEEVVPSFISLVVRLFQVKLTLAWSPFGVMMLAFILFTCSSSTGAV